MVRFRNAVGKEPIKNWYVYGDDAIAFSRGAKGFIALNAGKDRMKLIVQTGLPAGKYCDVITGNIESKTINTTKPWDNNSNYHSELIQAMVHVVVWCTRWMRKEKRKSISMLGHQIL